MAFVVLAKWKQSKNSCFHFIAMSWWFMMICSGYNGDVHCTRTFDASIKALVFRTSVRNGNAAPIFKTIMTCLDVIASWKRRDACQSAAPHAFTKYSSPKVHAVHHLFPKWFSVIGTFFRRRKRKEIKSLPLPVIVTGAVKCLGPFV